MRRFLPTILTTLACVVVYVARDEIRNVFVTSEPQDTSTQSVATGDAPQIFAAGIVEGVQSPVMLRFETPGKVVAVRVRSGEIVKAGQLLAELESDASKLRIARAQAQLRIASVEQDRGTSGRRTGGNSVAQPRAIVHELEHPQRPTSGAEGVSSDGFEVTDAQVASAQAELALEQLLLEKSRLMAPIDGTILSVAIQKGDLAGPTAESASITMVNRMKTRVRAFVEELDAMEVATGQRATVIASGKAERRYQGVVLFCSPFVQPKSHRHLNPGERLDVRVREIIVEMKDAADLLTGLPVEVFIDPVVPARKQERLSNNAQTKPAVARRSSY